MYNYTIEEVCVSSNDTLMVLVTTKEHPGFLFAYDEVNLEPGPDGQVKCTFKLQILSSAESKVLDVDAVSDELAEAGDCLIADIVNKLLQSKQK